MRTNQRVSKNEGRVLNATEEKMFTGFDNWKVVSDLSKSRF